MKTLFTSFILSVLFTIFTCPVNAQLSGIKTIGPTGNYTSFAAAVADLAANGLSGPVLFNVSAGTYSEQISIPAIAGASVTNTITFKGLGDSTTLSFSPSASNLPIIAFNSASHIIIDSLKINVLGSQGWGILFKSQSDSITIKNCHIVVVPNSSATSGGIASSGSISSATYTAINGSYLTITNNLIDGGNFGINIRGISTSTSTYGSDIQVNDNIIQNFGSTGVTLSYNHNLVISGNEISSSISTAGSAISLWNAGDNCQIISNKCYINSNQANTRVIVIAMAPAAGAAGVSTLPIIIANNFIQYAGTNTTAATGLLLKNKAYLKVYNNTIDMGNIGLYAIWFDANNTRDLFGIEVKNNILSVGKSTAYFFFNAANSASFKSMVINHNDFYNSVSGFNIKMPTGTSSFGIYSNFSSYTTNIYGYGTGAKNINPEFNSATDLHVNSFALDNSGTPITIITDDIDGDIRNTTTPDIGADEYTPIIYYNPTIIVKNASVPIAGASVVLNNDTMMTNAIGEAHYTNFIGGSYPLVVFKTGFLTSNTTIAIPDTINNNIFNINISPCIINNTDQVAICKGENYIFGTQTLDTAGVYTETFVAIAGCDSIVVLTLTVNEVDILVNYLANVLTAAATNATYQWVNCDDMSLIAGETAQVFAPTTNGNYGVIVTQNNCSDTSVCYSITTIGIQEINLNSNIQLFPNPIIDQLTIDFNTVFNSIEVNILSIDGQLIYSNHHTNKSTLQIDISTLSTGSYILQINSENGKWVRRIVKM